MATRNKKRIAATLNSNGIGKFTPEEVYTFGKKDIEAVATILGDKPYLFGETPSSFDATVYSFLANLIELPVECPLNTFARDRDNLRGYCQRMKSNTNSRALARYMVNLFFIKINCPIPC